MAAPVLFRHESSLDHDPGPGHPERPERIAAVERALAAQGWLGYATHSSPAASRAQLEAVHDADFVRGLEAISAAGGGRIDGDTVLSPGSFAAAAHGAGGACAMVDVLLGAEEADGAHVVVGASVHRPPGHHAEADRAMGFCLLNSAAVAARHARDAHGCARVAIVDWDVHHGNGTGAIFSASDEVLFASIHQMPLWPGTGAVSDIGVGAGEGYTVNLPVPPGSGDETFCSLVEHVVVPLVAAYRPGLVLISAGFDATAQDPLASCRVTVDGYTEMAGAMRRAADGVGAPVGVVLEGGYALDALTEGLSATLRSVVEPGPVDAGRAVHPLAREARTRLAAHWPDLAGVG